MDDIRREKVELRQSPVSKLSRVKSPLDQWNEKAYSSTGCIFFSRCRRDEEHPRYQHKIKQCPLWDVDQENEHFRLLTSASGPTCVGDWASSSTRFTLFETLLSSRPASLRLTPVAVAPPSVSSPADAPVVTTCWSLVAPAAARADRLEKEQFADEADPCSMPAAVFPAIGRCSPTASPVASSVTVGGTATSSSSCFLAGFAPSSLGRRSPVVEPDGLCTEVGGPLLPWFEELNASSNFFRRESTRSLGRADAGQLHQSQFHFSGEGGVDESRRSRACSDVSLDMQVESCHRWADTFGVNRLSWRLLRLLENETNP